MGLLSLPLSLPLSPPQLSSHLKIAEDFGYFKQKLKTQMSSQTRKAM